MSFLSKLLPFEQKPEKIYAKEIAKISALESEVEKLSAEEIRGEIRAYKAELSELFGDKLYRTLISIRPRVFALVREASKRSIGQRHYDVQILGGIVLSEHKIAEMKTGEGKTLTATLPLVLFALAGKGAHIVTVNDYLARWQASQMGQIFHYLGLSVSSIQHEASFLYDPEYMPEAEEIEKLEGEVEGLVLDVKHMRPVKRKQAYEADITYGTNNEFGFDYLRDNMAQAENQLSQRELFFAIVDEVDSILIDEARTPLIISSPDTEPTDKYFKFAKLVGSLQNGEDFLIDEKRKSSSLTESGMNKVEKALGVANLYDTSQGITTLHHIEQALQARANFLKDRDYVVRDGEIIIVDEFTGRLMFGRRYSEGLHQAIEAKENVKIQQESRTLATITFQNLFRLYEHLAGMTGTAKTEEEEFFKIYRLQVVQIPTNRKMVRQDLSDVIYKTEEAKWNAIVEEVKKRHQIGQPILIGTVSIAKNEMLADKLTKAGVSFELLNAKNHEREAHIISQAGRFGAVTLATNIAGRGVDILLGGNPVDKEEAEKVRNVGGLHILGTERHESRRIDNQLRGRAGRQGDPGSTQFFVSMEDDLMRLFGGEKMRNMMNALGLPDDLPIEHKLVSRSIESAQKQIEGLNFDRRKHVLEYDDVLNHQRTIIYKRRKKYLTAKGDASFVREEVTGILKDEIAQLVNFAYSSGQSEEEIVDKVFTDAGQVVQLTDEAKERVKSSTKDAADSQFALTDILQSLAEEQLEKKAQEFGSSFGEVMRFVLLHSIDTLWMEHLDTMDHLRTSVNLQGYAQKDPVVEYKRKGYELFKRLISEIGFRVSRMILKVQMQPQNQAEAMKTETIPSKQTWVTNRTDQVAEQAGSGSGSGSDIGRNDPCPCGSGKKYKKCGLVNSEEHQKLMSSKL